MHVFPFRCPWNSPAKGKNRNATERNYGVEYAEACHYIGPGTLRAVDDYIRNHGVPLQ